MAHYLIEFRLRGYAKRYSQELIKEIGRKFRVRGMKDKVSHVTLYGPFTTNNERRMVSEVNNLCKKYDRIYFSFKGFNYFNNPKNKVVYLNVVPSEHLKQFRHDLSKKLNGITSTKSHEDKKSKEEFEFHSTIAFKDIDNKFESIWRHMNQKTHKNIRQTLLRATIIKNSKILYEYDFLQKKLLNRKQALSKKVFRETIRRLKQQTHPQDIEINRIVRPKELTIWSKIKSFFMRDGNR